MLHPNVLVIFQNNAVKTYNFSPDLGGKSICKLNYLLIKCLGNLLYLKLIYYPGNDIALITREKIFKVTIYLIGKFYKYMST